MSHTFKADEGTVFNYDTDLYGGRVLIRRDGEEEGVEVLGEDLMQFLAERLRMANIERLEQRDWREFLRDPGT